MKAYQDVCADLIMLLEDIEESLEEITKAAAVPEPKSENQEAEIDLSWLKRCMDFKLKN